MVHSYEFVNLSFNYRSKLHLYLISEPQTRVYCQIGTRVALAFMWVPDSYSDCDYVSQIYVVINFSDQLIHW